MPKKIKTTLDDNYMLHFKCPNCKNPMWFSGKIMILNYFCGYVFEVDDDGVLWDTGKTLVEDVDDG